MKKVDILKNFDFLYNLTRSTRTSTTPLAQNAQINKKIDYETYSFFLLANVYFKEYGANRLYQLLGMRSEKGLNE
uniref:Uncharacterized protein n=1 Tax=Fervidicoccus fontis TaxID=683846 RepID=A0A7C1HXN6_9CREN